MPLSEDDLRRIEEEERARYDIRRRLDAEESKVGSTGSTVAGLASFFIPGLGQIVQGRVGQGVLFFVALLIAAAIAGLFSFGVLAVPVWIVGAIFAAVDAAKWRPGMSEGGQSCSPERPTEAWERPADKRNPSDEAASWRFVWQVLGIVIFLYVCWIGGVMLGGF